jgi:predicted transposase YbfD/YdcC
VQWVIGQISFHNGQSSEITSVRQLLQQLDVQGAWVTLDALHTQKNSL